MFELGQTVYFFVRNDDVDDSDDVAPRIASAAVLGYKEIKYYNKLKSSTFEQQKTFEPFGKPGIWYATIFGTFHESRIFSSKTELVNSLLEEHGNLL